MLIEEVARPAGFAISFLLDAAALLGAAAFGFFYRSHLGGGSIGPVLIAATFFAVASIFCMLLIRSMSRRFGAIALQVIALLGFFYDEPFAFLLPVGLSVFFFLAWGEMASRDEQKNSLEIKFFRITRPFLNKFITGLALFSVLLYLPHWDAERSFFSPQNFDGVFAGAAQVANQFYQEINFTGSFGDFAESLVKFQFQSNNTYKQLLPAAQDQIVVQERGKMIDELQKSLGVEVRENQSTSSVFYDYLIQRLNGWRDSFGERFLAAWAIVVFFLLRGFGFFFSAIAGGIAFFIYQLLLALGLVHIVGESRMKEVLEFS